jgi:hypothetical protein
LVGTYSGYGEYPDQPPSTYTTYDPPSNGYGSYKQRREAEAEAPALKARDSADAAVETYEDYGMFTFSS